MKLSRQGRKFFILIVALLISGFYARYPGLFPSAGGRSVAPRQSEISTVYRARTSNVQVSGEGIVSRVLPDDRQGIHHQKFILKLPSGQSLLVAHNIDLAPRIPHLKKGDRISFIGEYEWNPKGGVLHWTHKDPHGRHASGRLKRGEHIFQ